MSDKQTNSAPMSFVGSTRRLTRWARNAGGGTAGRVAAWSFLVLLALPITWVAVALWYVVVLGIFGLFTIPFRFLRRGQRKQEQLARRQLAATEALLQQRQT